MSVLYSTQVVLALIVVWIVVAVVLVVGAAIVFLRRSSDRGLIGLWFWPAAPLWFSRRCCA